MPDIKMEKKRAERDAMIRDQQKYLRDYQELTGKFVVCYQCISQ